MSLVLSGDGAVGPLSATEVGYLDGLSEPLTTSLAAKADLAGATFTGLVFATSLIATSNTIAVQGNAGTDRVVRFRTGTSNRWAAACLNDAESGSNAGSNFGLLSYTDDGAYLSTPLSIQRSNNLTRLPGAYSNTSASAANVVVASGGELYRSTSSLKYKTDVQDATAAEQDAVLLLRPVTYRSLADADDSQARFWGFIAEEVEQIDPRLVTHNEDGEPEGVQYDRIVPALVGIIQRQQAQIDALTARLDAAGL